MSNHGLRPGMDGLRDLMDRLLSPDGCPWDREQTLSTLRPYLIEEAYEVLEAMDDPAEHCSELGDLLFQIVFQAALREREGTFNFDAVIDGIRTKMVRRHPHVFGDETSEKFESAEDVSKQWAQIKRAEGRRSPLGGIPRSLPALQRAWRMQENAASLGFDWPDIEGVVAKLREEWKEFEDARDSKDRDAMEDEFGDLLFVLVRLGQKLELRAEDALRRACNKFERRFTYVLDRCADNAVEPAQAGLERLESWWQEAKRTGR